MLTAALLLLFAALAGAQSLMVYSEFARIDKNGQVTAPETPREILSPALVRNGYTSFQLVVDAAPELHWRLFVGQNPDNAVKVTLYRENGEALEAVDLPVEGDGPQVFWMDLWTGRDAPVARVKVEPELYIKDDWVTYPMEARVMEATVPETPGISHIGIPCHLNLSPAVTPMSRLQTRNAEQDGALAARLPKQEVQKLGAFCDMPVQSNVNRFWTEGYLRVRDYLFRVR
ncbi:MAG: hypothetical protein JO062_16780 [Bryobacterales bacterium]|nr:hypothetical protein [Bryobacterales bacterium]